MGISGCETDQNVKVKIRAKELFSSKGSFMKLHQDHTVQSANYNCARWSLPDTPITQTELSMGSTVLKETNLIMMKSHKIGIDECAYLLSMSSGYRHSEVM